MLSEAAFPRQRFRGINYDDDLNEELSRFAMRAAAFEENTDIFLPRAASESSSAILERSDTLAV